MYTQSSQIKNIALPFARLLFNALFEFRFEIVCKLIHSVVQTRLEKGENPLYSVKENKIHAHFCLTYSGPNFKGALLRILTDF